jgi:hypothetical protein
LNAIEQILADPQLDIIRTAHDRAISTRETARLSAEALFSGAPLPGIGHPLWKNLWESARRYSEALAYPTLPYPPADDTQHCLLCQQSLTLDAVSRMRSFEAFVQADTETQAEEAETAASGFTRDLTALDLALKTQPEALKELQIGNQPLYRSVRHYIASARLRRFAFLRSLGKSASVYQAAGVSTNPLEQDIKAAEQRIAEFDHLADPVERAIWQSEFDELNDRHSLGSELQTVDRLPGRIHSPVQILVLPLNLYIGLVDTVALVGALEMRLATLVQLRRIDLHPAPNTTGIHSQAPLCQ